MVSVLSTVAFCPSAHGGWVVWQLGWAGPALAYRPGQTWVGAPADEALPAPRTVREKSQEGHPRPHRGRSVENPLAWLADDSRRRVLTQVRVRCVHSVPDWPDLARSS